VKTLLFFSAGLAIGIIFVYFLGIYEFSIFIAPAIFLVLSLISLVRGRPPSSNTSKERVCLIIPAHNEEDSIERSIRSALSQDYENLSIVLVNDGSKDKTGDIMKKYSDGEKVIYTENYPNKGKFRSILDASKAVKADIYAIVDADNEFSSNYVRYYVERMKNLHMTEAVISTYFSKKTFASLMHFSETVFVNWVRLMNLFPGFTGMGVFLRKEVMDFLRSSGLIGRDDGVMLNKAQKIRRFKYRFFMGPPLKGVATHDLKDFIKQRDRWYTLGLMEDAKNGVFHIVFAYGFYSGVVFAILL
jgi:glycosyltransferase involved in cell wall biosynthesis